MLLSKHQELSSVLKRQCINTRQIKTALRFPPGEDLWVNLQTMLYYFWTSPPFKSDGKAPLTSVLTLGWVWTKQTDHMRNRGVTIHPEPYELLRLHQPILQWLPRAQLVLRTTVSSKLTTSNSLRSGPGPLWAPQPELCCYGSHCAQKIKRMVKGKGSEFCFIFYFFFKFMRVWILIN